MDQHWDNIYKNRRSDQDPWTGSRERFLNQLWEKYQLPLKGNILDVGCGRGDKSIFFAQKGFQVWGVDISTEAIQQAKNKTLGMDTQPNFSKGNAAELNQIKAIGGVTFDVVVDLLATQFLTPQERQSYITDLQSHLKSDKSFFIYETMARKDKDERLENVAPWVQEVAVDPQTVRETFQEHFNILDRVRLPGSAGISDVYIMKAL